MKSSVKNLIAVACMSFLSTSIFAEGFTLTSKDMQGQMSMNQVFNGFGCTGKNISPQLQWTNIPKGTKSFAVTVYDPDAPTGSGWWHWLVFDINKSTKEISSNSSALNTLPKGSIETKTDYGIHKFGGACPPKGDGFHTYVTTLYALNVAKLGLDEKATPALVGYMLNSHVIEKSSIVTYYKR